jgi:hypothetical protein
MVALTAGSVQFVTEVGAFVDGMVCSNPDCEVCFSDCEIELPISFSHLFLPLQKK